MTKGYTLRKEDREDIENQIIVTFITHLNDYNPSKSAPTTFFSRYFKETIREQLQYNMHVTAYEGNNIRIMKKAINSCILTNTPCSISVLADKSGLSPKVVKKTLKLMNRKTENIDDDIDIQGSDRSPEDIFIDKEANQIINKCINNELTPEESTLLRIYLDNKNEQKRNIYKFIAKRSYKDITTIIETIKQIKTKLGNSEMLKEYFLS